MNYYLRKTLLLVAVLLFAVVAPFIVLYAIGYRPSFDSGSASQVGVLLLETTPRRAEIVLDGVLIGRTPRSVANVRPGLHTVRLTREGYRPWEKSIEVQPAKAIELRGIRLFPERAETRVLAEDVASFSLAPNRRLMAVVSAEHELSISDTEGQPIAGPQDISSSPQHILWSPDNAYILLKWQSGQYALIDVSRLGEGMQALAALQGAPQAVWDPRIPGRILALRASGEVVALNVTTNVLTSLTSDAVAFATSARQIFTISTGGQISRFDLLGQPSGQLPALPDAKPARLLVTPAGRVAAVSSVQEVFVLNEENQWVPAAQGVNDVQWSPDGLLLFMQSGQNELHVFNVDNELLPFLPLQELQLVNRLSRPITHPQWFAGGQHLLYQIEDEVTITEIDTRDHPITTTIDTTNMGDAQVTVGEEGETLFYLKSTDGQIRLQRALLVLE